MRRDVLLTTPIQSSFLSVNRDAEIILRKLFIESKPYSDLLKRLILINTKDCLDTNIKAYNDIIKEKGSLSKLIQNQQVTLIPKIRFFEHEDTRSYIILTFNDFTTNEGNPEFRDCFVNFDILCHTDYWDVGDYRLRPYMIAGYIDGILNNARLSGVGDFSFVNCSHLIFDENLSGLSISYKAVHFTEDKVDGED